MLGWSGSSCVLCGHSSADLVSESFVSTPTLQLTLQKLCREVPASHKFDVNRVFKEIASPGGSLFCWPCLAALYGRMSVVSQIICLKQRLEKFAGCIGKKLSYQKVTVGHGTHPQKKRNDLVKESPEDSVDPERREKCLTADEDLEDPSQEGHRKLRKLSKGRREVSPRRKLSPTPSKGLPVSRPTTRSGSSLPSKPQGIPIPIKQTEECLTTDTDIEESSQEPHRKRRKLSKGRVVTSNQKVVARPSTASSVSPSTTKSDSPLYSLTARIPGVENCPECDFSVDLRTPAQAKSSMKPVPLKTLVAWRKTTKEKLALHYRDNHMPPDSQPNVQRTKDGSKLFLCPQCPYKSVHSGKLALHYFRIHVLENKAAPSKLSCPTQGCSFSVDIPVRRGIFTFQPPPTNVKDALAMHVLTEHDIPSSAIHNSDWKLYRNTTPLFIETSSNQKEYRCTRCPHTTRLPEKPDKNLYREYRKNFLRHFYDCHLSSLV